MSERYLIINADDFGICTQTNVAIEQLFNEGRITSTTIMTPGKEAVSAINAALRNPKIKMGLHITLNSDFVKDKWESIAPAGTVPSLLDEEGKFQQDINLFYFKAKDNEITTELNAQYHFVKDKGYLPMHADSHCGTLYGLGGRSFMKQAFELCQKYRLPLRFPRSVNYLSAVFAGHIPAAMKEAHSHAVKYADYMGISLPQDIITNPQSIQDLGSYDQLKNFYLKSIMKIGEGVTELFLHPSKENTLFMSYTPQWRKRMWEYQFLLEDDVMRTIEQEGIRLVSWDNAPFKK